MNNIKKYKRFIALSMIMILLTTVVLTDNRKAMANSFAGNLSYELLAVILGVASGHKISDIITKDDSKRLDRVNNGDGTYTVNVAAENFPPVYLTMTEAQYQERYGTNSYSLNKDFNRKIQGCMTYEQWHKSMIRENADDVPYGPLTWSDYKTAYDKMRDNNKDNLYVFEDLVLSSNNLKTLLDINSWESILSYGSIVDFMNFVNSGEKYYALQYYGFKNDFVAVRTFDKVENVRKEGENLFWTYVGELHTAFLTNNVFSISKDINITHNMSERSTYFYYTNNPTLLNFDTSKFKPLTIDLDSIFKGQTIDLSNNKVITYDNLLKPDAISLPDGITDVNSLVNTLGVTDGDISNANVKALIESILGQQTITTTGDTPIGGEIDEEWYRNIQSLLERISANIGVISGTDTTGAISGKIDELIDSNALTRSGVIDAINEVVQELVDNGSITLEDVQGLIAQERERADTKELNFVTDLDTKLTINNWTLGSAIVNKFPFCVPFDLIKLVKLLKADPVAPKYEFNFKFKGLKEQKVVLDMKDFEPVAKVSRWFFLILFVGILTISTRSLIKG